MTAILTATNIRSIDHAKISLSGQITLLVGRNKAGKTTLIRAIQALTGDELAPATGVLKHEGAITCTTGCDQGRVDLEDDESRVSIKYTPDGVSRETTGDVSALPTANQYATGVLSLLDMKGSDRNKAFWSIFQCSPTREQLDIHLKSKRTETCSDKLWDRIEKAGWDGAHKDIRTELTTQKGKWEGVTGERWGAQKASSWRAVAKQPEEQPAAKVDQGAPEIHVLEAAVRLAEDGLEQAKKHLDSLPPSPDNPAHRHQCPSCEAALMLKDGRLQPYASMPEAEVKKIREGRASADGKLTHAQSEINKARSALARAQIETEVREEVKKEDLERHAKEKTEAAAKINKVIERYVILEEALGPNGVRKDVRGEVVDQINDCLTKTANDMGLQDAKLVWRKEPGANADAVTMEIDGTPYIAMSGAERWLARAILQIEIAKRADSGLVVFDEANILDARGRNGFFGALSMCGIPSIVAMSINKPDQAPDLESKGLGQTLWVAGGTVVPVSEVTERAAA